MLLSPAQTVGDLQDAAQRGPEEPRGTVAGDAPQESYGRTPSELVPYGRSAAPYRRFFLTSPVFRGPGREEPEPLGLETVRVGLLAPFEGSGEGPAGLNLKRGVELALEEANRAGGYKGLPFELLARNDQALWGSSANTLVELAYERGVWAVIGSIDSNSTHVALRAALKAEVPIVNVGSSDPTMTETGIPWIVRVTPDDRQTGYRLARLLFEERGFSRVAVLRSSDRYGRFGVREFRDAARRLRRPLPLEILFPPQQSHFPAELDRLAGSEVDAVVVWAKPRDAGRFVAQMRARGLHQPVFGTDRMVTEEFLAEAGDAAEGVQATAWLDPTRQDDAWVAFRRSFRERFGDEPDAFASYGYDAARLVIESVRSVGLNRARIRDALTARRSYRGVAGEFRFDPTSNNVAPLEWVRIEGGRFVYE